MNLRRARMPAVVAASLLAGAFAAGAPAAPRSATAVRDSAGWRLATAPYAFRFPADHASHPDYRVEWWYYTGHLRAGARRFGYELTFFRVGLDRRWRGHPSRWAPSDVILAHAALTDEGAKRFRHDERAARPALDLAGADSARYRVWAGDWSARLDDDGHTHRLAANADGFGFALALEPVKPPAIHGEDGVSRKAPGLANASHYYSLTRLATRGTLVLGGDTLAVEGDSWMDHEFGSGSLGADQVGWDWTSVQLDDGTELMLYALRRRDGTTEPLSAGTWIAADGRTTRLALEAFQVVPRDAWTSPVTGARYPSGWEVRVPSLELALTLTPVLRDQELVATRTGGVVYWEGAVRVEGVRGGRPVNGRGYVELTGYAGRPPGFRR